MGTRPPKLRGPADEPKKAWGGAAMAVLDWNESCMASHEYGYTLSFPPPNESCDVISHRGVFLWDLQ